MNSLQSQDPGLGSKNQAKYPYFSRLAGAGLVSVSVVVGLGLPLAVAQARAFSYLLPDRSAKSTASLNKVEPKNSQTIAFLEAATNVDPNPAKGGGDITVVDDSALLPDAGPSGTIADIESNDHQGKASIYVARKGDTLPQVAKMFDVSVNTILWANDLPRGAKLIEGQTLVILPIDGVQHTVKKGDTLKGIAKKYKADADEIAAFNDIDPTHPLAVGDTLIIPDGEEAVVASSSSTSSSAPRSSRARLIASYPSIGSYFTNPAPEAHKTQGIHGFNGVDLGAPIGTPIYAAADGVVIVSKYRVAGDPWFGGYGNYVMIQHPNGTQTLYGHMSTVYVAVGAKVNQGQLIGEIGNTGKSTGPHLHFEVRGAKNFMN